MKKNEIAVRFYGLVDIANKLNQRNKERRFYPISEEYGGKLVEFGMYDYLRKKYILSNVFSTDAVDRLKEIEKLIQHTE